MMRSVQGEKIQETIQLLFKYYHQKNQFMKENIPIQQEIIKKIQDTAQLTLALVGHIQVALREERDTIDLQIQSYEKSSLNSKQKYKLNQKKNPNQQFTSAEWNRNISRIIEAMSYSHVNKVNSMKQFHKMVDACFQEMSKEQMRYRSQLRFSLKELATIFQNIDNNQKEQTKILTKLVKESKSKDLKQSIYFLGEVKKAENLMNKQFDFFIQRNKKILELIKSVVKNEKKCSKRLKQLLTQLLEKKKEIFKQTTDDQKLLGLLTVIEDGVQESRQLYLEKTLISPELQVKITKVVPPEKSKIHHMMKYFSLQSTELEKKYSFFSQIKALTVNMSFKTFEGVSLAQGWIITSFTPCTVYLTFDHYLAVYDNSGSLIKKIQSSMSRINKVSEKNIVYLEQRKKGIFSDSKEEYQLKFDNGDRMQQFVLFIQNQIS